MVIGNYYLFIEKYILLIIIIILLLIIKSIYFKNINMKESNKKNTNTKNTENTENTEDNSPTNLDSTNNTEVNKNKRYRKDKPWDNDPNLDKWKIDEFKPGEMQGNLLETSSFSVLYPSYREKYIDEVYPFIKMTLKEHGIKCELDKLEGSITVTTSAKTWDPYVILKARDMVKLISRSVPFEKAKSVLGDGIECDVIKIRHFTRNKERFIKRRQRLIGPKGMTLKALELLTDCYILVQGTTVSVIGNFKQLKIVRRIVLDCMMNIHPVYHIKELMIKEQLSKDPELKNENWDRFLPQFKKRNIKRKKLKAEGTKKKNKEEYNPFPPEQLPRKIDMELETGEYWEKNNNGNKKDDNKNNKKDRKSKKLTEEDDEEIKTKNAIREEKNKKKLEKYIPPKEPEYIRKNNDDKSNKTPSLEELKNKFIKNK